MKSMRPIVLDANILIRLVVGERVRALLAAHLAKINFLAPDTAFEEARRHLPAILLARRDDGTAIAAALEELESAAEIVTPVPASSYEPMRVAALARIGRRDPLDWPVLACALLLNCPIWTEDRDFFGVGVPIWTTALVELYFTDAETGLTEH